jgi:tetratricopeptide (TPR) repeat protein
MKKLVFLALLIGVFITPSLTYAQENQEIDVEQSSEVFLEEYSDTFQENFFEGLKQKGIRNYDRAITYFLECKRLQPNNTVVTFELAKFHLYDKQFIHAQEYALEALNGEPENYWYAETLVNVIDAKKSVIEDVKDELPWGNVELRGNLAEIYFLNEDYVTAKSMLKGIKISKKQEYLASKINDSISQQQKQVIPVENVKSVVPSKDLNSLESYKSKIKVMLTSASDNDVLLVTTEEAIESFPSQPYFYYANGAALNRALLHKDAIDILETALDYLIEDTPLENAIYKELANAYTATNNTSKANMYLSKIKSGF